MVVRDDKEAAAGSSCFFKLWQCKTRQPNESTLHLFQCFHFDSNEFYGQNLERNYNGIKSQVFSNKRRNNRVNIGSAFACCSHLKSHVEVATFLLDRCEHMNATSAMENLTLATNLSECYLDDNAFRRRPFLFFYLAVIITAIPSNAFSLYVSWQHIKQKNELGVYLFNLALSDLTFTVGLSLCLDFLWRGVWVYGASVCVLSVYLLLTNFYTSDALLCCIAVDRYLAVVHPLKYTFLRKVGTAAAVSVAIWVLVVCFNVATITWKDSYHDRLSVCFNIFPSWSENLARANVARFLLGFIVPVLLVVFSSWGICEAVKSNQATEEKERKRISKLLMSVLLSLLFCFGPVHIMMLICTVVDDCRTVVWLCYLYKISIAISSLNCLADPLLYCLITRTGKANVSQVVLFFQVKRRSKDEGIV